MLIGYLVILEEKLVIKMQSKKDGMIIHNNLFKVHYYNNVLV